MASYPTGEQPTIVDTTEPALVATEMQKLIEWTNEQVEKKTFIS